MVLRQGWPTSGQSTLDCSGSALPQSELAIRARNSTFLSLKKKRKIGGKNKKLTEDKCVKHKLEKRRKITLEPAAAVGRTIVCVHHIQPFFYPSTSSTTSVRADSSILVISVTAQVSISRRVHRYKLALRDRQGEKGGGGRTTSHGVGVECGCGVGRMAYG